MNKLNDKKKQKKVLLVEPEYYSRFPPLGLLKLATYFRSQGHEVKYVRGKDNGDFIPDEIYVTSLFTWAWESVYEAVKYYKEEFSEVKVNLGGIYASLMPEDAKRSGADYVHVGLYEEADACIPAWDLVPEWDGSIIFFSRGCIRKCKYCAVPKIEGDLRSIIKSIKPYVYKDHTKIIFWDNNILALDEWDTIFEELVEVNKWVDFNQGLDARLINKKKAQQLSQLKTKSLRLAYDTKSMKNSVKRAIDNLNVAGVKGKKIIVYTLFNFKDTPDDFFERTKNLLNWGVVSYPMRYEPLDSLKKNQYISKEWTKDELDMVAKARRVLGFAGSLPPYEGLVKKFNKAQNFHEAFELWAIDKNKETKKKSARWKASSWQEALSE